MRRHSDSDEFGPFAGNSGRQVFLFSSKSECVSFNLFVHFAILYWRLSCSGEKTQVKQMTNIPLSGLKFNFVLKDYTRNKEIRCMRCHLPYSDYSC